MFRYLGLLVPFQLCLAGFEFFIVYAFFFSDCFLTSFPFDSVQFVCAVVRLGLGFLFCFCLGCFSWVPGPQSSSAVLVIVPFVCWLLARLILGWFFGFCYLSSFWLYVCIFSSSDPAFFYPLLAIGPVVFFFTLWPGVVIYYGRLFGNSF